MYQTNFAASPVSVEMFPLRTWKSLCKYLCPVAGLKTCRAARMFSGDVSSSSAGFSAVFTSMPPSCVQLIVWCGLVGTSGAVCNFYSCSFTVSDSWMIDTFIKAELMFNSSKSDNKDNRLNMDL